MKIFSLLPVLLCSYYATASPRLCDGPSLETLPVRQGGRVKPLRVLAKETFEYLTGRSTTPSHPSTVAYCLLSSGSAEEVELSVPVEHPKLRELLAIEGAKNISAHELPEELPTIRAALAGQVDEAYKKALEKIAGRTLLFGDVVAGRHWFVPIVEEGTVRWTDLASFFTAASPSSPEQARSLLEKAANDYATLEGSGHLIEVNMDKMRLPVVSMFLSLVALALLVVFKRLAPALVASLLCLSAQATLIVLRILVSGRAPITNMYETVLFSGFGALALGGTIAVLKREKAFLFAALTYNVMTLMMMNFATGMLDASINPLVPVLRDNFWLSTHVTTIILSYGALALSWVLANTIVIRKKFGSLDRRDETYYADIIYTCLKYGTTLLAAGIILGGIWADYSWGRFWGWDPKETWSLIVLCLYTAVLHGRYTAWIKADRFATVVSLAFLSVLMAWFGVNYILASGLHSYGFSEGGAVFLASVFAAQLIVTFAPPLRRGALKKV